MLWKFFYAGSQIRAVQIRAMRNRASRGMTVVPSRKSRRHWSNLRIINDFFTN